MQQHEGLRHNQWNPSTGERQHCHYLNLTVLCRGWSGTPATYKVLVTIVITCSRWLLSQMSSIVNAVGVVDPLMPKARRVE